MFRDLDTGPSQETYIPLSGKTRMAIHTYYVIATSCGVSDEQRKQILNEIPFVERAEAAVLFKAFDLVLAVRKSVIFPTDDNIKEAEELWKVWQRNFFRLNPWKPDPEEFPEVNKE